MSKPKPLTPEMRRMAIDGLRETNADKIKSGEWFPLRAVLERLEKEAKDE